jgi:hypothetical protein
MPGVQFVQVFCCSGDLKPFGLGVREGEEAAQGICEGREEAEGAAARAEAESFA